MDYEKKYNDALERLRAFHRDYDNISTLVDVKELLEKIFPELRESEDERTRKELIVEIKSWEGIPESKRRDYLSYLEKQKEQRQEWSEEDERKRQACISTINEVIDYERERWEDYNPGKPYRPIMKYDEQIDWLKSLRPQPKQEWSGVDDLRLHQTIDVCDRNGYPILSKWLKGLLRRVTPQSSCNPAWRIWRNGACGNSEGNPIALVKESCGYKLVSHLCADGEKYIMLSDLEKLPGYNEK